jgi:hypothetical protein
MKHNSSRFSATCLLLVTALLALCSAPASAEQPVPAVYAVLSEIKPSLDPPIDELRKIVGQESEVTFTVMNVGGKTNIYLNSQAEWRSADCFTAMLEPTAGDELKKLGIAAPYTDLIGRQVRCRGQLELSHDQVRIVVRDVAKQLELLGPDAAAATPNAASAPSTPAVANDQQTPAAESPTGAPVDAASADTAPPAAASPETAPPVPANPATPYVYPPVDALQAAVGEERAVTFRVMNAGGRTHVYINSQKDYRRPDCFTAQVEPEAVDGLTALGAQGGGTALIGKLIEVSGKVRQYDGRVSIVVTDVKNQLKILDEPAQQSSESATPADAPQPVEVAPAAP